MHSGAGRYHSEHDRRQTQPSPASRARSGRGVYRELDHVAHRCAHRRVAQQQHVSARFTGRDWASRGDCPARDHELVFPQNLLGRLIRAHNRRRKALLENARGFEISQRHLWWGLILLGFTSLYREGFEVVLFLQSYNLRLGGGVVLKGALLGIVLSGMVAVLTFVLQQRLPYRKMLITTGILLGVVLLVMVGEQAQEMQLAHWIPTTQISGLANVIPPWMGMWFAIFPTVETLVAQLIAAVLVIGSYYAARHFGGVPPQSVEPVEEARSEAKVAITEQLEAVP